MCVASEVWLCAFSVVVAVLLRCSTSLHPYSGQRAPPMFGDYEAQRHWMEITYNLPVKQWYHNTSDNDLLYWGLDYPPLTAYHSYLCGAVANALNASYVKLHQSRGFESEQHKLFMRYTVLLVDVLIFIPAVLLYHIGTATEAKAQVSLKKPKNPPQPTKQISPVLAVILSLFYPGIILIDHGHFQYNCVSLGLAIFAAAFICRGQHILASIFFCFALNYKQMELYHSLPFFVYLLSTCVPKPGQSALSGFLKLCKIAAWVVICFGIIWAPFLRDLDGVLQVLKRLFPVSRGLFEDKVSNIWCLLNVFYKFKEHFDNSDMFRLSTFATLTAVLPSSADLFLRPNKAKFVLALINSSLAFFLFSYQVHEKTILLVAIPVMLFLPKKPMACFWFLVVSVFSIFPLILKDKLLTAFFSLVTFYVVVFQIVMQHTYKKSHPDSGQKSSHYRDFLVALLNVNDNKYTHADILNMTVRNLIKNRRIVVDLLVYLSFLGSLFGFVLFAVITATFSPPESYPDLFSLAISCYSCVHFVGFFVYFNVAQFKIPLAFDDIRNVKLKAA